MRVDQKRNKSSKSKVWLTILGVIILICGGLYYIKANKYNTHFMPNTKYNRIDIGNLTYDEAISKIKKESKSQKLTIYIGDKKWKTLNLATMSNFEESQKVLKLQLHKQAPFEWPISYFKTQKIIVTETTLNTKKVNVTLSHLKESLIDYNISQKPSVNAKVTFSKDGAHIQEGKKGTKIVVSAATEAMKQAILHHDKTLNLNKYYVAPAITKNSQKMKDLEKQADKIIHEKAEYSLNNKNYRIPEKDIASWLFVDEQGKLSINEEKVTAWLTDFAADHNLKGKKVPFKTTKEGTVQLEADVYSWSINVEQEVPQLCKELMKGKSFKRVPITDGSASAKGPLIGKDYVEVDLRNQKMYVYKKGKCIIKTDIVSGKPATPTPTGFFYVWNKQEDAVLRGQDYASPVEYWMPIDWTGVGIHDSNWQYAYGGTRWRDGFGSHGCVNTPPTVMAKVYANVSKGTPVVVFK